MINLLKENNQNKIPSHKAYKSVIIQNLQHKEK